MGSKNSCQKAWRIFIEDGVREKWLTRKTSALPTTIFGSKASWSHNFHTPILREIGVNFFTFVLPFQFWYSRHYVCVQYLHFFYRITGFLVALREPQEFSDIPLKSVIGNFGFSSLLGSAWGLDKQIIHDNTSTLLLKSFILRIRLHSEQSKRRIHFSLFFYSVLDKCTRYTPNLNSW